MKTTRRWLLELEDGYRELAFANEIEHPRGRFNSLADALQSGFGYWGDKKEGWAFWLDVYSHYEGGRPLPPLPKKSGILRAADLNLSAKEKCQKYNLYREPDDLIGAIEDMQELASLLLDHIEKLQKGIKTVLKENAHLADGDICTLKKLKDLVCKP